MKLLILMPSFPSPTWGAGTRNYYFLRALAAQHTVSLLCLIDEKEDRTGLPALEKYVHKVRYVFRPSSSIRRKQQLLSMARLKSYSLTSNRSEEVQQALDKLLAEEHFDAVFFESALIADYRLPQGVKRVIDQHNVEYALLRRTFERESSHLRKWYNWLEYHLLRPAEVRLCAQADVVLTTSEPDCLLLKETLPGQDIQVVPNGVDLETFQCDFSTPLSNQLVFTGAMNYYPNIEAVLSFARRCWPQIRERIPNATWKIVGREPPLEVKRLEELPGVIVTGTVSDVRPYLNSSSVAIAPLQVGGGTRLKILEAFAMGKAVVSTSIGCEGLSVVPGKHLVVADRPEDFAEAVITLLLDPEKCQALGRAGRTLVEEEYSWERCCDQLLSVLGARIQERQVVC